MDTCESGEVDEETTQDYFTMANTRGIYARTTRGLKKKMTKNKPKVAQVIQYRPFIYNRNRYIFNNLTRRSGAVVFSSCRGGEFSYESNAIENGFFTEKIINALSDLSGTDKNRDYMISIAELQTRIESRVAEQTSDKQHPTIDRNNLHQQILLPGLHE
ncbi:caspase family protein [Candidatus Uabimicrobium amorphum]|nr:caspase family protein [Candidatus Uabimicrobium amorphum]